MKCHDGEECKLGCTEDHMQCALPVSIVDELRTGMVIHPKRAAVIADYVEKLEADLAAAQRELSAWEQATHEGIDGKWLAEDIWPRVAELLAQEGGK